MSNKLLFDPEGAVGHRVKRENGGILEVRNCVCGDSVSRRQRFFLIGQGGDLMWCF